MAVSRETDSLATSWLGDFGGEHLLDAAGALGVGEVGLLIVGDDLVHDAFDRRAPNCCRPII